MKSVYVLGNGQLGRMLRQAGEPLGIRVIPVGEQTDLTQPVPNDAVVTAEIEHWPDTEFTRLLAQHAAFFNRDVFPKLADRLTQKQRLDALQLSNSPWCVLEAPSQWPEIFRTLGPDCIVKLRKGGYDGRGQWRLSPGQESELPKTCYGHAIVERAIPFSAEVSLVGARTHSGQCLFYPLTYNWHQAGILKASVAFPSTNTQQHAQAKAMLSALLRDLNYVGVMAMECFMLEGQLLINELAPRVHNSGHWTQNGASISQFELHLRALLDLPSPLPCVEGFSAMINLIGIPPSSEWLSIPRLHLHWYEKEVRPGRKVGHLNLHAPTADALSDALLQLLPMLPTDDQPAIRWCLQRLQTA